MNDELNLDVKQVQVISEPVELMPQVFMLTYMHCMAEKAKSKELRSHWTIMYKYVYKQITGVDRK